MSKREPPIHSLEELLQLLDFWRGHPLTQEQKDHLRWRYVREGWEKGEGWPGSFDYASAELDADLDADPPRKKPHPAHARPDMIAKSHNKIQKLQKPKK
jgi:hypothetical protein